jgi:hypothetical protein
MRQTQGIRCGRSALRRALDAYQPRVLFGILLATAIGIGLGVVLALWATA